MSQICQWAEPSDPLGAGGAVRRQGSGGGRASVRPSRAACQVLTTRVNMESEEREGEGKACGGAEGQEATANDWKSRSEGIGSDWEGRGMEGKERKKEAHTAACNSNLIQSSTWGISEWWQVGVAGKKANVWHQWRVCGWGPWMN